MCGLAGILTNQSELDIAPRLDAMLHALRHRGTDDEGTGEVALTGGFRLGMVHTRLAILDLSPGGHQPMHDPVSGSWIVYNGEVYNHQDVRRHFPGVAFSSSCDTETILKAWVAEGERSLDRLRGMFAFGLWDARRQRFWLVRDRLGIKPLYVYRIDPGTWVFGSELRDFNGLRAGAAPTRFSGARRLFRLWRRARAWTMLAGVESLLPAEAWCFDPGAASRMPEPRRTRYWKPDFEPPAGPALRREEVDRTATSRAPRFRGPANGFGRSRWSVPLRRHRFQCCGRGAGGTGASTAYFFGRVPASSSYDESEHARVVAGRFSTQHTELLLEPASMLVDYDKAVGAYDQPSIDGVNSYFISQAVRRAGIKVALSGLGGDELFAGYPYFRRLARLERGLDALARTAPCFRCCGIPRRGACRHDQARHLLQGEQSRLARYAVCRQVMAPHRRESLFLQPRGVAPVPLPPVVAARLAQEVIGLDAINAHSLLECSLYMANMLLRDLDQMSMAHALEVREPLLDHRLVEAVAGIPGAMKLDPGATGTSEGPPPRRSAHRAAAGDPPRRKMGFVLPWEQWLRGELRAWVGTVLTDRGTLQASGLEPVAVEKLWQDFLAGRPGTRYTDVLCLAHLLHWVKQHGLAVQG